MKQLNGYLNFGYKIALELHFHNFLISYNINIQDLYSTYKFNNLHSILGSFLPNYFFGAIKPFTFLNLFAIFFIHLIISPTFEKLLHLNYKKR